MNDGVCPECFEEFHLDDCGGYNPPCPRCGLCGWCCKTSGEGCAAHDLDAESDPGEDGSEEEETAPLPTAPFGGPHG